MKAREACSSKKEISYGINLRFTEDEQLHYHKLSLNHSIVKIGHQYAVLGEPLFFQGGIGKMKKVLAVFEIDAEGNIIFPPNQKYLIKT